MMTKRDALKVLENPLTVVVVNAEVTPGVKEHVRIDKQRLAHVIEHITVSDNNKVNLRHMFTTSGLAYYLLG